MIPDMDYLYYDEPVITMKSFVELMFVSLANKDNSYHSNRNEVIFFSNHYKNIVEEVLYQENEFVLKFSKVINISMYYYHQEEWEAKFDFEIEQYLKENMKNIKINPSDIEICLSEEEIDGVLFQYDEETLEIMDDFTKLLNKQIIMEQDVFHSK